MSPYTGRKVVVRPSCSYKLVDKIYLFFILENTVCKQVLEGLKLQEERVVLEFNSTSWILVDIIPILEKYAALDDSTI